MGEGCSSPMPLYQIRAVGLLRAEMHMAHSRFSEFVSLVRSAAKRYLDCTLRPEEQDPGDLQRLMRLIHQRQPSIAKKYEDSWPVMAYLEIYILSRIRNAAYYRRRFGCYKEGYIRCPDPIWLRYAEAKKSGAPFRRNCQVTERVYCVPKKLKKPSWHCERTARNRGNGTVKKNYPPENRVSVVVKQLPKRKSEPVAVSDCTSDATTEDDLDIPPPPPPPPSPPPSLLRVTVPSRTSCIDPVLHFLSSAKPNLADFHSHFVDMGFTDETALNAFFSWPVDVQESMMKTQLGGSMNALQLHGLFVAMRAHRESN
ncbi:hypothetical protein BKA82DRAFT_4116516 [Pisolithus tinctorius]|nr:hypothetical protein BKA82DRAFT_4116516 [Pisolithus tinctorius]